MGLLQIIDDSFIGDFVRRKSDIISETNPEKIYVENIRAFFGVSTRIAKFMCKLAVRSGHFVEHTGYICPNINCRKIIYSKKSTEISGGGSISCTNCELREEVVYNFNSYDLEQIVFYTLKTESNGKK